MADLCNRCGVHMDDGHLRGSADCDKFLISKLDADLVKEKATRVGYQDIVYQVCNILDYALGTAIRGGKRTTIDAVVDRVRLLSRCNGALHGALSLVAAGMRDRMCSRSGDAQYKWLHEILIAIPDAFGVYPGCWCSECEEFFNVIDDDGKMIAIGLCPKCGIQPVESAAMVIVKIGE